MKTMKYSKNASGNVGQSLVDVQLNFVRVQLASEQDEDHVDAEILHARRAPLSSRHESEIRSRRCHNIFVKSPTSQQFGHGSRMRKVKNAVRFSRRSQNDGIEISGDVDDGIAGLHPVDVVTVSIFIIIEQVVDVLENEQIRIGEGSAPRRQLAVVQGLVVATHGVSQRNLICLNHHRLLANLNNFF